jgi:two-component system cell cycle response regulator DivK
MQKTILIVEDNALNQQLFAELLEEAGYATLRAGEGLDAFALAKDHRPDLILMDIQLPAISGLEVTRWLKDDPALMHIPVIAITAYAMPGDEERMKAGGCEAYIPKPISTMTFLKTIARYAGATDPI